MEEFGLAHLPIVDVLRKADGQAAGKQLKKLICKFHLNRAEPTE